MTKPASESIDLPLERRLFICPHGGEPGVTFLKDVSVTGEPRAEDPKGTVPGTDGEEPVSYRGTGIFGDISLLPGIELVVSDFDEYAKRNAERTGLSRMDILNSDERLDLVSAALDNELFNEGCVRVVRESEFLRSHLILNRKRID